MIEGVTTKPLRLIPDERGYLMEILRDDDELFLKFGQVYVTACYPGVVKAWHAHSRQVDHICCLQGTAKLGLFDDREDSPTRGQTQAFILGMLNPPLGVARDGEPVEPLLVQIPPLVWHGFTPADEETVIMLNVPTEHYVRDDPDELRRDPFDPAIPFEWNMRGG